MRVRSEDIEAIRKPTYDMYDPNSIEQLITYLSVDDTITEKIKETLELYNDIMLDIVEKRDPYVTIKKYKLEDEPKHYEYLRSVLDTEDGFLLFNKYPKKIIVTDVYRETENSSTNRPDFDESITLSFTTSELSIQNIMNRYGNVDNDTYLQKNDIPQYGGYRIHFRFSILPLFMLLHLPNGNIGLKAAKFVERLYWDFIHQHLVWTYNTVYGQLVRTMVVRTQPVITNENQAGSFLLGIGLQIPITSFILEKSTLVIKEVNPSVIYSIDDGKKYKYK